MTRFELSENSQPSTVNPKCEHLRPRQVGVRPGFENRLTRYLENVRFKKRVQTQAGNFLLDDKVTTIILLING